MLFSTAVISSLLAVAAALPEKRAANPTVTIASGVLIGTATRVSNQPSVTALASAFIGIPFASNPPRRFEPPSPPSKWSASLTVQTNKPICLQQQSPGALGQKVKADFNNPVRGPDPVEDESCLYLSVYAPPDASPSSLKTVMFWLYGGNLAGGGSAVNAYNGSSLAVNEDVVVVVPNYRTNIFGFSNSPDVPFGKQNSGFLDQRFALQWVQQNIAKFGGDPAKVTLFGESAGGYSIKQLLANPPSPLPFRAAILESTGFGGSGNSTANFLNVSNHFGCTTPSTRLACLQGKDARQIQYYVGNNSLSFQPVIGDGTSSGTQTNLNIANGTFANVSVMLGSNYNEARIFLSELGIDNSTAVTDGVLAVTGVDVSGLNLSGLYPAPIAEANYVLIDRIATDLVFTCTTSLLAGALRDRKNGAPVWRYRYDGAFPDVSIYPNVGAYHSSEIFEVFGTYPVKNQFGSVTPDQISLANYMQGAWASFAKDPSKGPGWNQYGKNFNDLAILGGVNNTAGLSQQNEILTADYPCVVFDPLLLLTNSAY
ncbi:hypothetical protein AMS68_001780 [Peltaster fructicola]|uniref:Carboxylic ester hydrolase n=1 Tax=Peltaster fructicola TaxID=286661 RepID=A0A6H0XNG9_9PEZI|nr:hypothetical protein AMS68_001780 [Peltaster fructicola]